MAGQTVVVSVLADTKKFASSMDSIGGSTSKFATGIKNLGIAAVAAVGTAAVGLGAFAVNSVKAASDLEQALGGVDAVFKENSAVVRQWAEDAAKDLGLNKTAYSELATIIGSQLKNMGLETEAVAGQTNDLIGIGADLAAQFGGSTSDAVSALSSLLRGERDPIERYGVSINDAAIKAKLAELGLEGLSGEAEKNARLQATLAILTEQTADAQGAFARESETLAGKQARLRASYENIVTTLGTALLPVATAATDALGGLLDRVAESEGFQTFIENLSTAATNLFSAKDGGDNLATTLAQIASVLSPVVILFNAIKPVLPVITESLLTIAQAIADGLIEVLPKLQPLIEKLSELFGTMVATILPPLVELLAVILPPAIDILIAALDLLLPVLEFLIENMTGIYEAADVLIKFFTGKFTLQKAYDELVGIQGPFGDLLRFITRAIEGFKLLTRDPATFMSRLGVIVRDGIRNVINFIAQLPGQIVRTLSNLGSTLRIIGGNLMQGLISGVISVGSRLVSAVMTPVINAVNSVKRFLGIRSPSRLFRQLGAFTIEGLEQGLSGPNGITSIMRSVSGQVSDGFDPSLSMDSSAIGARQAGRQYNITVQTGVGDPIEIGRTVKKYITDYERVGGIA